MLKSFFSRHDVPLKSLTPTPRNTIKLEEPEILCTLGKKLNLSSFFKMNSNMRSLNLIEMPFLSQKLGFINKVYNERMTGSPDFGYSNKVLVGNWFDKQAIEAVNKDLELITTYRHDYMVHPGVSDIESIWGNRMHGEGSFGTQGQTDMATVYDLAFRCKVRDYVTGNYGNVTTSYNKKECKQMYWSTQCAEERRIRFRTEYMDAYIFTPHNAS